MPASATLQDVADRAGVHRSTVALALRDHPRIGLATRRRVRQLAKKLGYQLNPLVAALMSSRRTGRPVKHVTLAFVTNYPTRFGWQPQYHPRPDFFPGAAARAKEFGYQLEHFWLAQPGMTPGRMGDILQARGINGAIIARLPPGQHSLDFPWDRFSCVAFGMTLRSPLLHHVTENHFDTAWQAMQQCLDRGYPRVGFVFSQPNDSPRVGDRWLGAYLGQQSKLPANSRLPPCPGIPTKRAQFLTWFKRERPDALIVNQAASVIEWLSALGKSVPRDVGLVDLEFHPGLDCAGVYIDPAKIGAMAVEMLISQMHRTETGVPVSHHETLLTGEWHEGDTLPVRH
ncbi:MAG: LacI family DNA-binding transcriptional regulator [Opitutaceae bacterium]